MTSPCHVLSVVGNLGFGGDENRLASIVRFMDPAKFRFSVLVLAGGPDMDSLVGSLRSAIEGAGGSVHQLAPVTCPGWLPGPAVALVRSALESRRGQEASPNMDHREGKAPPLTATSSSLSTNACLNDRIDLANAIAPALRPGAEARPQTSPGCSSPWPDAAAVSGSVRR